MPDYTVETRLNGRRLDLVPTEDPFIFTRVVVGRWDLLRSLWHGSARVEINVAADPATVRAVMGVAPARDTNEPKEKL